MEKESVEKPNNLEKAEKKKVENLGNLLQSKNGQASKSNVSSKNLEVNKKKFSKKEAKEKEVFFLKDAGKPKEEAEKSQEGVEEFLADGVVVLYNLKHGNVRENAIEVLKLRGASHQKKIAAMQVTGDGIVVYPEQEVFSEIGGEG